MNILFYNVCYGSGFMLDGFIVLDSLVHHVKWQAILGHIGQDRLKKLTKASLLRYIEKIDLPICEHYLVGTTTRLPFGKAKRATLPLQLIHYDICGPMNVRA